ncbi:MAG: AsmA family protein [Bacteroidales bacterium]|nr:AsmA family protein [Bacteroidales bacterium]
MEENISDKHKESGKRRRFFKRTVAVLVGTVSFVLVALVVTATVFQDKIADVVLNQIYRYANAEITHKTVSFSMIRKFPMASLQVGDMDVSGKHGGSTLLKAEHVFLQFNVLDLLRGNYTIRRIDIDHAQLQLITDEKGNNNWDIFNVNDSSKMENVSINLHSIQLKNVDVSYENEKEKIQAAVLFHHLSAKGNFHSEAFTAQLSAEAMLNTVSVDKTLYLSEQSFHFYTKLHINTSAEQYRIESGNFNLGILDFVAQASLSKEKTAYRLLADLSIKHADIEKIIEKLPEAVRKQTHVLKPEGVLSSSLKIDGILGKKPNLNISGSISCKNGVVQNIENEIKLSKIKLQGDFSLATANFAQSFKININEFSGKLNNGRLHGEAAVENLQQPEVNLAVDGRLNLEDLHRFLPTDYFHKLSGSASLNITFHNKFTQTETLSVQDFKNASIQGDIVFTNVMFQIREEENTLENLSGNLQFDNQLITAHKLKGKLKGNDFLLTGKIENMYPYILESGNRLNITADLHIFDFDLNKLFSANVPTVSKPDKGELELFLPQYIDFDFSFKADNISLHNFNAKNTSGKAVLKNNVLLLENLNLNTCDGKMQGKGSIKQISQKEFLLNCNADLNNINIQKLFFAFGNFGQDALTDKNLQGVANSSVHFTAVLGSNMKINPNSVSTLININIKNGQLSNFKPLESLSRFVELSELQNLRFETIENNIAINNSEISIPEMAIKTNALNLSVQGNHTFSGNIDYHIKLMLKEILAKKVKNRKNKEDFGEVIDDNTGTYLYLLAMGNMDNPKFKWDGQSAKKGLKQQFSEQKQQIQDNRKQNNMQTPSEKEENKQMNDSRKKQSEIELDDDW